MKTGSLLQMSGCVVDLVYRVDSIPAQGEEKVAKFTTVLPGGGFNAMFAARQFGMAVAYGGAHGKGPWGEIVRAALCENKIQILQPLSSFADQGTCVALIDQDGERTFISHFGAEGMVEFSQLASLDYADYDWIVLSGYTLAHQGSREALHCWVSRLPEETNLVFDPSPIVEQIPQEILTTVLRKACWVSCNAQEALWITQCKNISEATTKLLTCHSQKAQVIVRCGAEGCVVATHGAPLKHILGFKVPTVDTNGAGDTHIGAFLAGLSAQKSSDEAARFANAAAALSTVEHGSATSPHLDEVENFMANEVGLQRVNSNHGLLQEHHGLSNL